jgi:hypothetical protein
MTRPLIRIAALAVTAIVSTATLGVPAQAARADTTPPTAPFVVYASGLKWTGGCLPLTIGIQRSTDSVTRQSALIYQVFADGALIGSLADTGTSSSVWGTVHFTRPGPQTVTAKAIDAAGNRSAHSNANVVTAYAC